ncbi:hypothetical protein B7R77_24330 [Ralstonia solanacearum K60]|uniref:Uncharacterized protein n=1 Tax=Ralstonia solanacearum K60 TaxID=1091042 RepID=A0AAP7ZIX2_RALSL|nr:hypothetical protein BH759_01560 [Ralstonia solanacearum]OYQ09934.1 hypothetical protein B7R77_24330 [Ralstonia solanacearum K60]
MRIREGCMASAEQRRIGNGGVLRREPAVRMAPAASDDYSDGTPEIPHAAQALRTPSDADGGAGGLLARQGACPRPMPFAQARRALAANGATR